MHGLHMEDKNRLKIFIEYFCKTILGIALIPATLLLSFSFAGMSIILSGDEISTDELVIIFSMISGIAGYIGLLTALIIPQKAKLNLVLLLIGLLGFSLFTSFTGGTRAWKWLLFFEEPDEWFIMGLPFIASIVGVVFSIFEIRRAYQ